MKFRERLRARSALLWVALSAVLTGVSVPTPCAAQPAGSPVPVALQPNRADAVVSTDPAIATIRSRLTQRLSGLPQIDEISPSGMPGLYEVRLGTELFYSDAQGNFFIRGELIETRGQRNLTRERIDKLTAIDFDKLPLQDAIVWKSGTGQRRIAVFADPNCPYCKKFEAELQGVKDVTIYTFLYPILAADSATKSEAIWCSPDASNSWRQWMLKGTPPSQAKNCATPLERNLAFGKSHRIEGVPAVIFEDGGRSPGLLSAPQLERRLSEVSH